MKNVYIIAGPNGAGKTTFAKEFLPHFAHCEEFVNADLIATGLSPFAPHEAALQAGKLVIQRIRELSAQRKDFGFETTLSGLSYVRLLKRLMAEGYRLHLFYLWLPTADLAVKRVADRVKLGGHHVPEHDVRRRYDRGMHHFWVLYRPLLHDWIMFDNSASTLKKVAFGATEDYQVLDETLFQRFLERVTNS